MSRGEFDTRRLIMLTEAFNSDGFDISRVCTYNGKLGIIAESRLASNYDTGEPKRVYYLEGSPYEAGYLMGCLAEKEVSRMTREFANKVVFSFIGSTTLEKAKLLQEAFIKLIYRLSKSAWERQPEEIKDEVRGVYDGCKKHNPKTKVNMEHLIALNLGVDILCSRVYTGGFMKRGLQPEFDPEDYRIPLMCNAFTVSGKCAANGYYFGRDFMFPMADVLQDIMAMIIYNPGNRKNKGAIPMVSIAAPGMIGSIASMNLEGIAMGVDMSPGINCDSQNIGTNSLLLTRLCTQNCASAEAVVEMMQNIKRGVSWIYIVADGKNERSCIVEAGASGNAPDFTKFVPEEFRPVLPDMSFISEHSSGPFRDGIMVRWNNYKYPKEYLEFNPGIWDLYNSRNKTEAAIIPDAFSERGYINRNRKDKNCPSTYYFAPQREESDEILIATNHYIIPEMRYFAMYKWVQEVLKRSLNDIQWRYDTLNDMIFERIQEKGSISFDDVKELTGFLSPAGRFPDYYDKNPRSSDGKEIRIEGCDCAFDLKNCIVESHYGYYGDNWVRLSLRKYF